jgi:hypothetical protein
MNWFVSSTQIIKSICEKISLQPSSVPMLKLESNFKISVENAVGDGVEMSVGEAVGNTDGLAAGGAFGLAVG